MSIFKFILATVFTTFIIIVFEIKTSVDYNASINYYRSIEVDKVFACNLELCMFRDKEGRKIISYGPRMGDHAFRLCHANLESGFVYCKSRYESLLPREYNYKLSADIEKYFEKWNDLTLAEKYKTRANNLKVEL